MNAIRLSALAVGLACTVCGASAKDWPEWGFDASKNMVASATGIPHTWDAGKAKPGGEEIDLSTTKNVKWVAKLGSQTYGNPTIADGRVFVGTNNESPRDDNHIGDRGVVMCFDEQTGDFQWQLIVPKLGAGKVSDWEYLGICSSPTIVGNRAYVVTNRCEVVCLDVEGLANGNTGPFTDEGDYATGPNQPPTEIGTYDADIVWVFDMRDELGVFPHNIASSSVLHVDGRLYVTTSNGQDWSHVNIPAPFAPALAVLDAETGELLGEEAVGISQRLYHCNWSSPAYGVFDDRPTVIFGAGDGFCYGFNPVPVEGDEGFDVLEEYWRIDCNPPHYIEKDGEKVRYPTYEGPSEIISTPVVYKNLVYVAIGQDPEHGDGLGNLTCFDPTKGAVMTQDDAVWTYDGIHRSISTASIVDDLVFIADYAGYVHCLDALTGELYWRHSTRAHIWSSTLVADGKVYLGNEDGIVTVLAADKELNVLAQIEMGAPVFSTPVVANGVLYIASQTHLYAIAADEVAE